MILNVHKSIEWLNVIEKSTSNIVKSTNYSSSYLGVTVYMHFIYFVQLFSNYNKLGKIQYAEKKSPQIEGCSKISYNNR